MNKQQIAEIIHLRIYVPMDLALEVADEILALFATQWQPGVLEKCRTGLKECACSICNPDILNIMQRMGDEPV